MIDVALDAAKLAGDLALKYFKSQSASWRISYKPDNTPVTRADREAEQLIRKIIAKKFPDHGIIGEEFEPTNPQARFKWVIDPIDGTKEFIRGLPFWSTLLAVLENGKPIIGVLYSPAQEELFVAQKGRGTTLNSKMVKVSKIRELNRAFVSHDSITRFEESGKLAGLLKICQVSQSRRSYGTYSFNLLLKGNIDIFASASGGIWDYAAPSILIEEAGGKFTDFSGKFSLTSYNGLFSNGLLHHQVIKLLND